MTALRILVIAPAPPLDVNAVVRPLGSAILDARNLEAALSIQRASPCQVAVLDGRGRPLEQGPAAVSAVLQIPCVLLGEAPGEGGVSLSKLAESVAHAAAPAQEPPVDWADLSERLEGDEDLGLEILSAFAGDAPELVRRLKELVGSGADLASIARLAHQIKGAAANASAKSMRAAAHQIELAGKASLREGIPLHLAALEAGLSALQRELSARGR